jgi:hypothetical protein
MDVQQIIVLLVLLVLVIFFTFLEMKVPWLREKGFARGNFWQSLLGNIVTAGVGYAIYIYFLK